MPGTATTLLPISSSARARSTSSTFQGYLSNVILNWDHPSFVRFADGLSRFSRLVVTDRRGLGCSERFTPRETPPIETLVDDLLAVLDEIESERPAIFATGDCGFIAMPFAATYPDRIGASIDPARGGANLDEVRRDFLGLDGRRAGGVEPADLWIARRLLVAEGQPLSGR